MQRLSGQDNQADQRDLQFFISDRDVCSTEVSQMTKNKQIVGEIAEIDLDFRMEKINAEEAWRKTQMALVRKRD